LIVHPLFIHSLGHNLLCSLQWCSRKLYIITPHRSTYRCVNAAYCYRPSSVVCRSVTPVSPAKTAEPIDMRFGLRTLIGPGTMH